MESKDDDKNWGHLESMLKKWLHDLYKTLEVSVDSEDLGDAISSKGHSNKTSTSSTPKTPTQDSSNQFKVKVSNEPALKVPSDGAADSTTKHNAEHGESRVSHKSLKQLEKEAHKIMKAIKSYRKKAHRHVKHLQHLKRTITGPTCTTPKGSVTTPVSTATTLSGAKKTAGPDPGPQPTGPAIA